MKVCIPTSDDRGIEARVFDHFGSAPYFTICDVEKGECEVIENNNQHHDHGMCQPLSAISVNSVDAVVCGGMGMRAVAKLNEGGIKAYKVNGMVVSEIIGKYKEGALEEITTENACGDHGCH